MHSSDHAIHTLLMRAADSSFFRFLLVGGTTTAIDFVIYTVLGRQLPPVPAKLLSMLCSTLFAFFVNKNWTFRNKEQGLLVSLGKYYLAQAANIAANVTVNAVLLHITGRRILAFVGATGIAMCVNYLLQRLFVFRKKAKEGGEK